MNVALIFLKPAYELKLPFNGSPIMLTFPMQFRRAAAITTIILLIMAAVLAIYMLRRGAFLYSDPGLARDNATYSVLTRQSPTLPPFPTNLLSSISTEETPSQITFRFPQTYNVPYEDGPVTIVRSPATIPATVGAGSVSLRAVASAYSASLTNFRAAADIFETVQLTPRIYNPALQEMSEAGLEAFRKTSSSWEATLQFYGDFPSARFYFSFTNLPEIRLMGFQPFDARTKQSLTTSYGSSGPDQRNAFYYESPLALWHQTPLELCLSVATGPIETRTLDPAGKGELHFPRGVIKLMGIRDGHLSSSSTSDGRSNVVVFRARGPNFSVPPGPRTTFIFFGWPAGSSVPVDFDFFGENGKVLTQDGGGISGNFILKTVAAQAGQVKEIRVKYYPNLYRIIFTLSELPGLPEENRNIRNLFDARIPYTRIRSEWDFQRTIECLTAMEVPPLNLQFTNTVFPINRTNLTTRDLFLEFGAHLANPGESLGVDPAQNRIIVRKHPLVVLYDRIKKYLNL
ncbi:MAG TPA: hypothetical protein VGR78_04885 [Verrucomicrobiae bacterium]|jgi:hypothetical protein|nr:hypothetical protein [Verrucomicrobiae bacterium]